MKATQKELTDWAIRRIQKEYPEDIALLIAVEGHALDSDCHGECFDYFVPATERGNEMSMTFIIDGVGHDLYPRSWQRIENMAEFRDDFHNGLADAIILYAKSEEEVERFEEYRKRLLDHFADEDYMYHKALEKLDAAMEIHRTLVFEENLSQVRLGAGYIAYFLAMAVGYINGRYYQKRLELPTVEIIEMEKVPEQFVEIYHRIVDATDMEELKALSLNIIKNTREFLSGHKPLSLQDQNSKEADYEYLREWYQEMSLTLRRIKIHCDEKNPRRVFPDALSAQNEMNIIQEEFQFVNLDLLSYFNAKDLTAFKKRVLDIEEIFLERLQEKGITLRSYERVEDFLAQYDV